MSSDVFNNTICICMSTDSIMVDLGLGDSGLSQAPL